VGTPSFIPLQRKFKEDKLCIHNTVSKITQIKCKDILKQNILLEACLELMMSYDELFT
jgi:hypothetical protein